MAFPSSVSCAARSKPTRCASWYGGRARSPGAARGCDSTPLAAQGAKHTFVSTDDDFDEKFAPRAPRAGPLDPGPHPPTRRLRAKAKELGATIAFDAVCGELTGRLVTAMPRGSTVHVYGALSQAPASGVAAGESRLTAPQ